MKEAHAQCTVDNLKSSIFCKSLATQQRRGYRIDFLNWPAFGKVEMCKAHVRSCADSHSKSGFQYVVYVSGNNRRTQTAFVTEAFSFQKPTDHTARGRES